MKKIIPFLAGLIVAGSCYAQPDSPPPFSFTAITTNATAYGTTDNVTSSVPLNAWVDTVILDFSGYASPTCTVVVKTAGSEGTGVSRTLLTLTSATADGVYPVRDLVTGSTGSDISNVPARYPLVGDRLVVSAYGANVTNTIGLKVYVVTSPTP